MTEIVGRDRLKSALLTMVEFAIRPTLSTVGEDGAPVVSLHAMVAAERLPFNDEDTRRMADVLAVIEALIVERDAVEHDPAWRN